MELERSLLSVASVGLAVSLAVACGGATNIAGVDDAGTPSSSSSSSGSTGGSSGSSSGGATGSSSGSSSGRNGSSSGASSSGGSSGVAGTGTLNCGGGVTCMTPQVCCTGLGGGGAGAMCMATQNACAMAGGNVYTCTGAANCSGGQVCCVTTGAGGAPDVAQCQATCMGGGGIMGGATRFVVCQTSAECTMGLRCRASGAVDLTVCR